MGNNLKDFPDYGNYKASIVTDIDGRFPVVVYESSVTHLKVAVARVDGPLVNAYLTLGNQLLDHNFNPNSLWFTSC